MMNFLSPDRKENRQAYLESMDALRLLKLPRHSVFSHDKMNRPGKRRSGKWQKYGRVMK